MSGGCMLGWFDQHGYTSTNGLEDMEEILETRFAAVRIYHTPSEWGTVKSLVDTVIGDGRLAVVSHKLPKVANAWIAFHSSSTYDAGLDAIVERYRDMAPAEVVVIFHHEPRGNSELGSQAPSLGAAGDFRKAFRKFAAAFDDLPHVRIGYCEIDSHADNYPDDPLYPGSDVVDVFCHDVYNWGGYPGLSGWKDPEELFSPFVADAKAANKPLIFGEIGSRPNTGSHDRGQWLRDLAAYLRTGDAAKYVLGFCYYHKDNHSGSGHYWRFAQGDQAGNDKNDFIAAFSSDPHFLTTPIPVSLQAIPAPPADVGGSTPSGGTSTYVQPSKWDNRLQTTDGVGISEISGWASSPKGGAWAIRDSGNPASLYWMTQTSRGHFNEREIAVTSATNGDWEDCIYAVEGGTPYLYIHDNRDGNGAGELPKRLYKVAEPATPGTASSVSLVSTRYWKFPASASSSTCGSKQNCEAIFIFKGILYGVQKTDDDQSEVYRIGDPNAISTTNSMAGATEAVKVGTIGMHCPSAFALHADGTTVLTIQHGSIKIFRGKGDTVESLLTGKNTKIQEWSPTGNWEGADWYPYLSNDILISAENRDTYDVDASNGTAWGGGIPSGTGVGTPVAAPVLGPTTVSQVGAIASPGDYVTEEEPGLEFGAMTVQETGWIAAPSIASTAAVGTVELTRAVGPGYLFSPPVRYLQPFVTASGARGPQRLFAYLDGVPTPRNVYVLRDGTVTEAPPWDQELVMHTYHGGHVTPVNDTEADILADAGYGAYLVPVTEGSP